MRRIAAVAALVAAQVLLVAAPLGAQVKARARSAPVQVRSDNWLRDYRTSSISPSQRLWKINTHLFAANLALDDALDGTVNIPPFGEFPVAAAARSALNAYPATYRAGVLAPDLFPEMYTGGWSIHSDLLATEGWIADNWMRHVWSRAWSWPDQEQRDRVMAFAYGFLTHAAGDMFAHTYVSRKSDGAWVSGPDFPKPHSTAKKHVVLEGYIGSRTPETDVTMDVWPRFVAEVLIKDPDVRRHTRNLKHYQTWLKIYDWLGPQIQKAKNQMNNNIRDDAPYWMKCAANPVPCAKKEQMESWRLDIDRGLRALVDSSQTLGEKLMDGEATEGVGAMTGWASEWVPKMFGAHAIGEGSAAMSEFMAWASEPFEDLSEDIRAEVMRFLAQAFPYYYELYESLQDPAYWMDRVGFPAGTKEQVAQDMGLEPGSEGDLNWRKFEPLYNSVILSKLALLDGDGLNELVRRAGVSGKVTELFKPGAETNIMLGVVRSMTQSYQWVGAEVDSQSDTIGPTVYGICGPEHVPMLPADTLCGVRQRNYGDRAELTGTSATSVTDVEAGPVGGFALWGHPEAREKIFRVIFKGFGPGPGTAGPMEVAAELRPADRSVREASRTLGVVTEQIERMREIVDVMQGKVAGVVTAAAPTPAAPAAQVPTAIRLPGRRPGARPAPAQTPPKPQPPAAAVATQVEVITTWGERCCAKDIAELRAALSAIQTASGRLQNSSALTQLRRPGAAQLGTRAAELGTAIDAFANTRDAQSASSALANISRGVEALAHAVR